MKRHDPRAILGLLALGASLAGLAAAAPAARAAVPDVHRDPWIALFPGGVEAVLHDAAVPVGDREEGVVIAGPSAAQLDALRAAGVEPVWSAPDHGEGLHVLSHDRFFPPPVLPGVVRFAINPRATLYLLP